MVQNIQLIQDAIAIFPKFFGGLGNANPYNSCLVIEFKHNNIFDQKEAFYFLKTSLLFYKFFSVTAKFESNDGILTQKLLCTRSIYSLWLQGYFSFQ